MGIDVTKTTVKTPDNRTIDAELHAGGIDPDNLDPEREVPDDLIEVWARYAKYIRPRSLTYYFGPAHPVGEGFINDTEHAAIRDLRWTDRLGTRTSFALTPSHLEAFRAAVAASFGVEWQTEKEFAGELGITIDIEEYGWLTRRGMTCRVEADLISPLPFIGDGYGWTQVTIEGYAGTDGRPDSWITGHTRTIDQKVLTALAGSGFAERTEGGYLLGTPLYADTAGSREFIRTGQPVS